MSGWCPPSRHVLPPECSNYGSVTTLDWVLLAGGTHLNLSLSPASSLANQRCLVCSGPVNEPDSGWQGHRGLGEAWGFGEGVWVHIALEALGSHLRQLPAVGAASLVSELLSQLGAGRWSPAPCPTGPDLEVGTQAGSTEPVAWAWVGR